MENESDTKAEVKKTLDELRDFAKAYTMEDIKNGNWFTSFLRYSLETYATKVNAAYFRAKYPGLPPDAVVDRQVALAQNYSAIEGGLTSTAYSAAIVATIGSGGGSSPLTLPGAVSSFVIDLFFTTQIQLRLAYDISVLYNFPVDMKDPEDLMNLLRVAFGIKAGEVLRTATKGTPEAVRQGVKAVIRGPVLAALKNLPLIGKYLLQRNIIKFAIPVIGIPISTAMNYWTTGRIGQRAKDIFRDRASIRESAKQIGAELSTEPSLLLRVIWMTISADGKTEDTEASLLRDLIEYFRTTEAAEDAVKEIELLINLDKEKLFEEIRSLSSATIKAELYRAACIAAAVDRSIHAKELAILAVLADVCGVTFDEKAIRQQAKAR